MVKWDMPVDQKEEHAALDTCCILLGVFYSG